MASLLSTRILMPSDMADDVQGPAAVVNKTTGAVVTTLTSGPPGVGQIPYGSTGDMLPTGIWCMPSEFTDSSAGVVESVPIFDADATLIADVTSIIPPGEDSIVFVRSDHDHSFYVAVDGNGTVFLWVMDDAGVVNPVWWELPTTPGQLWGMTVNYAGTIAYWTEHGVSPYVVQRYDLANDVPLSSLATGPASSGTSFDALITLPDGSILVCYKTNASNPTTFALRQYDTAGTLLNSLSLGSAGNTYFPELGVDPSDATSFYVKSFNADASIATVQQIAVTDFSVLNSFTLNTFNGTGDTLVPVSCPLLVFPSVGLPLGIIGPLAWVHWPRRVRV